MTDKEKYEALVAEIEHQKKETSIGLNEWENGEEHGRMDVINALQEKIKSMHGEPVSEDLEKASFDNAQKNYKEGFRGTAMQAFNEGADWRMAQMMAKAIDGIITNAGGTFGYDVASFKFDDNHSFQVLLPTDKKSKFGSKVKVIVIKEG